MHFCAPRLPFINEIAALLSVPARREDGVKRHAGSDNRIRVTSSWHAGLLGRHWLSENAGFGADGAGSFRAHAADRDRDQVNDEVNARMIDKGRSDILWAAR